MANVNALYPSTYLKAADLNGKTAKVAVRTVIVEKIGTDTKPVLYFQGKEKGMVLNKTNAFTISQAYGPDTDAWGGAAVEIFPAYVDFQGKQVEALRIRIPPRAPANNASNMTVVPNARARAEMQDGNWQAPPPDTRPGADVGFDDEIPF